MIISHRISNAPFKSRSFDALKGGTPQRLATLRASAEKLAKNPHRNMQVAASPNWRTVRYSTFRNVYPAACPGFNERQGERVSVLSAFDVSNLPVRSVAFADEVKGVSISHRGWFSDSDQSETVRGIVASLPHGRYLPGYFWSSNGEYVLFTSRAYESAEDAASDADSEAEYYAELCREDAEKFDAMQDAEDEAQQAAKDVRKAWKVYRLARFAHLSGRATDEDMRARSEEVSELLETLRQKREALADATRAYEGA